MRRSQQRREPPLIVAVGFLAALVCGPPAYFLTAYQSPVHAGLATAMIVAIYGVVGALLKL